MLIKFIRRAWTDLKTMLQEMMDNSLPAESFLNGSYLIMPFHQAQLHSGSILIKN